MAEGIHHAASAPASLRDANSQFLLQLPSASVTGAALMLIKAIVGVGLFAMPFAYRLMGIGGGTIAMCVFGLLTFYTGMVLIRVHDVIVHDTLRSDMTFVSLTEYCFGRWAARVAFFLVVLTTLGQCGAYLVFISSVLVSLWPTFTDYFFAGLVSTAIIPLVLIRNRHAQVWSSAVGNAGVGIVAVIMIIRGWGLASWQPVAAYTSFDPSSFMQAFGIVGFLYGIARTIVVIERGMRWQRHRFGQAYFAATLASMIGWEAGRRVSR